LSLKLSAKSFAFMRAVVEVGITDFDTIVSLTLRILNILYYFPLAVPTLFFVASLLLQ
jgi:hypothetical protein